MFRNAARRLADTSRRVFAGSALRSFATRASSAAYSTAAGATSTSALSSRALLLSATVGIASYAWLQQPEQNGCAHLASRVPSYGVPGTAQERSFIAIKPDGVQRAQIGEIIRRFEAKGFHLVGMKLLQPTPQMAAEHYDDLKAKPFFRSLVAFFSSGPIVAMVWQGKDVIKTGRVMLGATNPAASALGTIRGDLAVEMGRNICHGSDGPEGAKHEIEFWFKDSEIVDWTPELRRWVYEN